MKKQAMSPKCDGTSSPCLADLLLCLQTSMNHEASTNSSTCTTIAWTLTMNLRRTSTLCSLTFLQH